MSSRAPASAPTQINHNPILAPPHIHALLERLHAKSEAQEREITSADYAQDKGDFDALMRDKFIALDRDKCWFVYSTILSMGAKNVVEAGTSYGVSTIYLALAVSQVLEMQNKSKSGSDSRSATGKVIATENEPSKAAQAREYWNEAGDQVASLIELREGDLRETLKRDLPTVDLLLLDIWSPLALPTLQVVQPSLRPGSVVITDNITGSAARYADLIRYLNDEKNGFRNINVPYNKGLSVSVYVGKE
ncbi:hypothetical protein I317_01858 [Kwoniella heveanensis CBS 569]|nr:hypothetical protein I317_01858 [Kwoniella heveanensis CBS 569]